MKRYYIHGFCKYYNGEYYICPEDKKQYNLYDDLFYSLYDDRYEDSHIENYGAYHTEAGLGGQIMYFPKVNLRIYVTNKKSTLDDAMISVLDILEGSMEGEAYYEGFSEYTITGLDIEKFCIGGHNIMEELHSYIGKYIHFVLEIIE